MNGVCAGANGRAAVLFAASAAHAQVMISTAATKNMNCADGVCARTATRAVLNAGDPETMLASGSAKVTTTGSAVEARDIVVAAQIGWSSTSTLALDAYRSIEIRHAVSIQGPAAVRRTVSPAPTQQPSASLTRREK